MFWYYNNHGTIIIHNTMNVSMLSMAFYHVTGKSMEKIKDLCKNKKVVIASIIVILCLCFGGYLMYEENLSKQLLIVCQLPSMKK